MRYMRIRRPNGSLFNIFLSLILFFISSEPNVFAATETFNPTGDTYVAAEIPDMKFCNETTVAVGTHTDMLGYVKFNISSIPSGSIINSAELRLWCIQIINNGAVFVGRVSSSWTECGVDWNHQPAVEPPILSSTPPGTFQWWQIDITSIVQEGFEDNASNMGFRLEKASNGLVQFHSSEGSSKPQLVISYTPGYYNASGKVTSTSTGQGIQSVKFVFSRVSGSGAVPDYVIGNVLGEWSQSGFEPGTTYRVTPTNQPGQPSYTFQPAHRDFSSSAGSNVTGLDFSADTSYSVTIQSQPTGADVRLGSVDASPTCTTECTLTGLEGNQIVWLTKNGYEDLEFVLTPNDDGTTKNFPLTAAITLNFTAPFSGASSDHIEYEGSHIGIRVLGAAPSDTAPESGDIHHASTLNLYAAGASTWQVDDTIKWHFNIPRSGRYKITVNGHILGNTAAAGTGVVYDCKHLLMVGANIVGEESVYSRLHDTLGEDVNSGIWEISTFGAGLVYNVLFPEGGGWVSYVIEAYEVYSIVKKMHEILTPVKSFNYYPILGDDWCFYADLEADKDYQFEFFVRSTAVGGVSAAVMYSLTDVIISFTDVTFEQISGSVTEPIIEVTPVEMLEMETTYVGQSTQNSSAFTVKNVGNQLLTGSVTIEAGPFEIISGANYSLNPGEESDISIRFLSYEAGIYTRKITFFGGGGAECYVRCEAREADPVLEVSPDYIVDFGKVACNTSNDMNAFVVANTGGSTLNGDVFVNSPFSIFSGGSYSLTEGQTQNVIVRFSPTDEGGFNSYVTFTGGVGATREVSGEGTITVVEPVIHSISAESTTEGLTYFGPIPALMQGTQPVTWSLINSSSGMTINPETGFVSWPNPTALGSPHEIEILATNAAGYDDETWQLNVYATSVPIVNIENPPSGLSVSYSTTNYNFSGTAEDSDGTVNKVEYSVRSGSWQLANGTADWNFIADLETGPNLVEVRAQDNDEAYSSIKYRTITREAIVFSISGQVTLNGGSSSVSEVTLSLSGDAVQTINPETTGDYNFTELEEGSYTVTPSLIGYYFFPASISYSSLDVHQTNQDFTGLHETYDSEPEETLPDWWEQQIIDADPNDEIESVEDVNPDDDFDGDGINNSDEYFIGSDPTVPDEENYPPYPPILFSPFDSEADVELTPELQTEDFDDPNAVDTHTKTQWQISTVNDFSAFVLDLTSTEYLTTLPVPELVLNDDTTYYWRVKFYDNYDDESEWSNSFSFETGTDPNDLNNNGIPDNQEVNEEVDLDNNGIPDIDQNDIVCVNTEVGDGQIGVKIGTNVTSIDSIISIDPYDIGNPPADMPLGIISFKLQVINPDDTAGVTVYLSEPPPIGAKWYKLDLIHGWREYPHATFNPDGTVTLALKDGDWQYGDADGTENAIIVDPSGSGGNNQAPTASFTANPTSGEHPLTVDFDATASYDADGTIESYAWDFGDDSSNSGEFTTHIFTSKGNYTVTLTVTDNDDLTDTHTMTIKVEEELDPPWPPCFIKGLETSIYGSPLQPTIRKICKYWYVFLSISTLFSALFSIALIMRKKMK